ncbi:A-factor biosynthesis hotdog protein [Nocardiopsis sp. Huas11]|uniref:AfsA-related hotdog domain-containing protein n=1 Tax=Nocardiopsis sp. Huas11 TaxID=2183912 RepID=UPI000EB236F9|nr:AfsA-related hotdog domain-containing protein [Nocardiopsis sp. Huas11]RKS09663.1 A-factor biosynthesis hotdog protein [Nocardiopsis sp. Huas11]
MTAPIAEPPARPVESLSFEQSVPCSIAHRRAIGEVFVTDSVQAEDGDVFLAIQLPRAHSLWFDRTVARHDTFSVAEAARQGSFVAIHRHLGVAVGLPFTLQRFAFDVPDLAPYADDGATPLEGVLRYRVADQNKRGSDFSELTLRGEVSIGGATAMTLTADVVFMPAEDYEALRAFQLSRKPATPPEAVPTPEPLSPAQVGRLDRRNVVIADSDSPDEDGRTRFAYAVDRTHPSFFDHDYDHVPGPFIVEGFRQAAAVTAHRSGALDSPEAAVVACSTHFTGFGEFGSLLECAVSEPVRVAGGRIAVDVGLYQFGKHLAGGRVELAAGTAS